MSWAKFEEDNREARNDRLASGNFFWTPYQSYLPKTPAQTPQNTKNLRANKKGENYVH